jgi:hypothetical protein
MSSTRKTPQSPNSARNSLGEAAEAAEAAEVADAAAGEAAAAVVAAAAAVCPGDVAASARRGHFPTTLTEDRFGRALLDPATSVLFAALAA